MSPTTTANFADLEIKPSRLSAAALSFFYISAASLLVLAWLRAVLPLPVILICLEMLWHEWLQLCIYCQSQQGRLVVKASGEIHWQHRQWLIERVKIRTRLLLLLRIRHLGQQRWLLICHDACDESAYRSLSLLCHSPPIYTSSE